MTLPLPSPWPVHYQTGNHTYTSPSSWHTGVPSVINTPQIFQRQNAASSYGGNAGGGGGYGNTSNRGYNSHQSQTSFPGNPVYQQQPTPNPPPQQQGAPQQQYNPMQQQQQAHQQQYNPMQQPQGASMRARGAASPGYQYNGGGVENYDNPYFEEVDYSNGAGGIADMNSRKRDWIKHRFKWKGTLSVHKLQDIEMLDKVQRKDMKATHSHICIGLKPWPNWYIAILIELTQHKILDYTTVQHMHTYSCVDLFRQRSPYPWISFQFVRFFR